MSAPRVRAAATWMMARRRWVLAAVIAATAALGLKATEVRPDYSIELLFPVWDPARQTYDRFKAAFPHEDTRAVVVVLADDLFTAEAARRLSALERELAGLPGVEEVVGPTTARTAVLAADGVELVPLIGDSPPSPERLAHARRVLTSDPLFAWNVVSPDGRAASIVVRLDPAIAGSDDGRQRLTRALNEVAGRHAHPGQQLIVSGVPPIRATFAAMILQDVNTLVPAALGMVLVLLWLVFRRVGAVLACLATILVSLAWTYGVLGVLGYPLSMMVSILPIIAIIICVSDSVHLVSHFLAARREGHPPVEAVAVAMEEGALPCLLTEVVLACGFLSLVAVNITAALHFGVAAACTMGLVWLANVTLLPLALSVTRAQGRVVQPPAALRTFDRFAVWIGRQVTTHPRRIVAVAALILASAVLAGTGLSTISYVFDDMRPGSEIERQIRTAERVHGGLVPLELFIEATGPGPDAALDPELLRLADRGARMLRELPEVEQANSLGDFLLHAGEALGIGDPLQDPSLTREKLVRALGRVPEPALFQDVLSKDRRALAVQARVRDCGSECNEAVFAKVDAWVAREQARLSQAPGGPKAVLDSTGQARIFKDVNDILMRGLVGSFGASLLISLLLSALMLRSWKLGVIAIIPNVAPIVLVIGLMAVTGVALKPVTVVLFSITLVIAEDDTLQLLSRLRRHHARAIAAPVPGTDPHVTAALSCMREVALPIMATSAAVSGGFLLLLASRFLSVAHLGMLIGGTLFVAVFADLFLAPLLVIWLKPFASRTAAETVAVEAAS